VEPVTLTRCCGAFAAGEHNAHNLKIAG